MKQVFSQRGQIVVEEVPIPLCAPGAVLVQSAWSLVSSGTERTDISGQRVLDRLRRQPEAMGKVWQQVKKSGLPQTMHLIQDKLQRPIPLGNSLSGVVIEVGGGVHDLAPGDHVACGGTGHAHHAEFVVVPQNLVARIPEGLPLREAAFVTLGAIALQGVRRAGVQIGETAAVVGLGLIGLLTVQILRAAGVRVVGIDTVKERAALAERLGAERSVVVGEADPVAAVISQTYGNGADAVLITASTSSSDLVNQAFEMSRERARIVVVGDVGLQLSRPTFYRKELDLVMSRSTGPGRYDPTYEERGVDYPFGHVRWTEQRNMEAFLQLAASGSVRVAEMIIREYAVEDAQLGYDALRSQATGVAVLLRYTPRDPQVQRRSVIVRTVSQIKAGTTRIAVIGAGDFARQTLLPVLAKESRVRLRTIVGGNSGTGLHHARRFGAEVYSTDAQDALNDPAVDAVIIATRHNLHATQVMEAARRGKAVFVEKPLALTLEECGAISKTVSDSGTLLTVGFNRRFAPLMRRAREVLARVRGSAMATYRVNAHSLPPDHWLLDPVQGGGRIVGEACHFFDLLCWLLDEEPVCLQAMAPTDGSNAMQELTATIRFSGGSIGTILYTVSGHPALPKERLEVFKGGCAMTVDDFRLLTVNGSKVRAASDEKGYGGEISAFLSAVRGETPLEITVSDGVRATTLALRAIESATSAKTITY